MLLKCYKIFIFLQQVFEIIWWNSKLWWFIMKILIVTRKGCSFQLFSECCVGAIRITISDVNWSDKNVKTGGLPHNSLVVVLILNYNMVHHDLQKNIGIDLRFVTLRRLKQGKSNQIRLWWEAPQGGPLPLNPRQQGMRSVAGTSFHPTNRPTISVSGIGFSGSDLVW